MLYTYFNSRKNETLQLFSKLIRLLSLTVEARMSLCLFLSSSSSSGFHTEAGIPPPPQKTWNLYSLILKTKFVWFHNHAWRCGSAPQTSSTPHQKILYETLFFFSFFLQSFSCSVLITWLFIYTCTCTYSIQYTGDIHCIYAYTIPPDTSFSCNAGSPPYSWWYCPSIQYEDLQFCSGEI